MWGGVGWGGAADPSHPTAKINPHTCVFPPLPGRREVKVDHHTDSIFFRVLFSLIFCIPSIRWRLERATSTQHWGAPITGVSRLGRHFQIPRLSSPLPISSHQPTALVWAAHLTCRSQ